jgi:glutathione synthase
MRIGFVVNDIATEEPNYTTTRLAMTALQLGHEAWAIGVGDFAYQADQSISALARSVPRSKYSSGESYLRDLRGNKARTERISVSDLDVLLLRNDPALDATSRAWAQHAGIVFGQRAVQRRTVVLNDPDGLSRALNKMYFQDFPEEVRPRTLITRDREEIRAFARDEGGPIVLKPLAGSGGQNVFLVRPEDRANLNQMIDAISRDGYVVAQEYLPAAEQGDMRLFMMNAEPLMSKGKYAAFHRKHASGDLRSNITAGGTVAKAEVTREALRMAEIIRPKLVMDGMFLVGLDLVGDKLMEVNVFSPGGLGIAQRLEEVNFTRPVIEAIERKVSYHRHYRRGSDNPVLATL